MTALLITILIASLLGSLHCAGMCGAFLMFAIGVGDPLVRTPRWRLQAAYHGGRLITYVALGSMAGALGSFVDLGGRLAGWQRTAAIGAGALMVGFASLTLLRVMGMKLWPLPVPEVLQRLATAGHQRNMSRGPMARALVTGLLTTLLPCGWLYAFVITAAGTAHPLSGAAAMLAFWIGTLPMLATLGMGIQKLSRPLAAKLPALTATAVLLVGLYTIWSRAGMTHLELRMKNADMGPGISATRVPNAGEEMPCCTRGAAAEARQ